MTAVTPVPIAAIYRPRGGPDGRPVAALDEDAFTLTATALEAVSRAAAERTDVTIRLVGAAQECRDDLLAAVVGRPIRCERPAAAPIDLRTLLEPSPSATHILVGAEYAGGKAPTSKAGDGAFACLVVSDGADPAEETSSPEGPVGAGSWLDAALALDRSARRFAATQWIGDWSPPRLGAPSGPAPKVVPFHPLLSAVSEGAYVPRPRYLEGLGSRWRFEADRCASCGTVTFPARGVCRGCALRTGLVRTQLPFDGGTVVSVTEIGRGGQPTEFDPWVDAVGSYSVALVDLAPGVRATLQVTDAAPGELRIGATVGTRLRRLYPMEGEWRYGRKAVPRPTP